MGVLLGGAYTPTMHIADGIISTQVCVAADAAAVGAIYLIGRRTRPEEVPRMGFLGAALFVASLVHLPLGGASVHPGLYGLAGIVLGFTAFPAIFAALLFQSLLFQHGGLVTVGVNAFNMGMGALLATLLWRLRPLPDHLRAFAAGTAGVLLPALLMASEFELSGYGRGFFYLLWFYAPVALAEGVLTAFIVGFFRKVQPALLEGASP